MSLIVIQEYAAVELINLIIYVAVIVNESVLYSKLLHFYSSSSLPSVQTARCGWCECAARVHRPTCRLFLIR